MKAILNKAQKISQLAARAGGRVIMNYFGNHGRTMAKNKNPFDIVTKADFDSEKNIIKIIKKSFPGHSIISEEAGKNIRISDFTWFIDPLDGTSNFTLTIPCFSVSIALAYQGKVILGTIYNPVTNELYTASEGRGATLNGKKIKVGKKNNLHSAYGSVGYWSRINHYKDLGTKIFSSIGKEAGKIRYISSSAWEIVKVAEGRLDFQTADVKFLDIAAASIIAREAGAICGDVSGALPSILNEKIFRIITANNKLYRQVVKIIKEKSS